MKLDNIAFDATFSKFYVSGTLRYFFLLNSNPSSSFSTFFKYHFSGNDL